MSALRSVGSPRAQRQAEGERSQGLKHLQEQVDSSDVKKRVEEDLRARMDQIRHERAVGPAKKAFADQEGDAPRRRVEAMGKGKLNDFEAEQFKEMAKLESEIHGLVAREEDLQLHDRLDDAKLRAVDAGVLRADAEDESLVKQKEMMSRQQRQERLVADRSARHELIQRQREHLMAQRSNIESDLAGLQVCVQIPILFPLSTLRGSALWFLAICAHTYETHALSKGGGTRGGTLRSWLVYSPT